MQEKIKMKAQISFRFINPDYSQKYANEYNFGKESFENSKYLRITTHELENVKSVQLINNGVFQLKLKSKLNMEEPEIHSIPDVSIYRFHLEDDSFIDFGVSKSILKKTHQAQNEKYPVVRCYFYIKSKPPSIELGKLVLDLNQLPAE